MRWVENAGFCDSVKLSKNKICISSGNRQMLWTDGCAVPIGLSRLGQQRLSQSVEKEMQRMSANTSNHLVNPAAREAMDKFKMEAAAEVGVNLKNGYNGELTSRQAGSVGGQMVKKMIEAYENGMK